MYDHFREAADRALDQTYDSDQQLSIVDYAICILTDERGVKHVFAFDSDFRTPELSSVPADGPLSTSDKRRVTARFINRAVFR